MDQSKGSVSLKLMFERYLNYYASSSDHTAKAKSLDIAKFMEFLTRFRGYSKPEKLAMRDWDKGSIVRFMEECLKSGEAPSTVSRRIATLKHVGRTFGENFPGFLNPTREVRPPKFQPETPKAIPTKELRRIERMADERIEERRSFIRGRNRFLFHFLLDTGLRADEVRLLRRGQLDNSLEWIEAVRTKGRKYRNVYITSSIRNGLQEYLQRRNEELKRFYSKLSMKVDCSLPLFISTYRADPRTPESFFMGAKSIWRAIREFSVELKLHPHLLRHSYAHDLLGSSNDIRLVAQALGHSDVRITMKYTERADQEVAKALELARLKERKASE